MSSARRRRAQKGSRQKNQQQGRAGSSQRVAARHGRSRPPSPLRVLWVPLALTLGLVLLSFVPRVSGNPILVRSFWGSAIVLLVWQVVLFLRLKGASEGRSFIVVLRPQHYVQAMLQITVFAYWGYYWRPVYDFVWLLVAPW